MSRLAKGSALAHVSDITLGTFALVPPSEVLNHLIRFLSTWSGTELRTAFLFSCFPLMSAPTTQQAIHGEYLRLWSNTLALTVLLSSSSIQ